MPRPSCNGAPVDDSTLINLIIAGLLDEFEPMKLMIEQTLSTITLKEAKAMLLDYAASRNVGELTKAGNSGKHNRAYAAQTNNDNNNSKKQKSNHGNPEIVLGVSYYGKPWMGKKGDY